MRMAARQIRIAVAALALVMVAGVARAELITVGFTAEDTSGRTLSGQLFYNTNVLLGSSSPGVGEFPAVAPGGILAVVEIDGQQSIVQRLGSVGGPAFYDIEVYNQAQDRFRILYPVLGSPEFPRLNIELVDEQGTAFDTHLMLPSSFNLSDFETRAITFSAPSISTFSGTITSFAVVPEPSTLALCGPAALLGLAGWRLRRGRKAA